MRWAVAAAVLLLAGCAAPAQEPPAEAASAPEPQPRVPLLWDLLDCQWLSWEVPVLAAGIQARLPKGFEPAPAPATGPAPAAPPGLLPSDQAALLGFEAVECAGGFDAKDQLLRSVPFARLYTPVVPPQELRDGRTGTRHAFTWAVLVADEAWRDRFAEHGLPVHDGGAIVGPSAQGFTARVAFHGLGTFSLTGRTVADEAPRDALPFRDFTTADGGLAAWIGTHRGVTADSGAGLWDATPDSWVADVLGATQGATTFRVGTYDSPGQSVLRPGHGNSEPFHGGVLGPPRTEAADAA